MTITPPHLRHVVTQRRRVPRRGGDNRNRPAVLAGERERVMTAKIDCGPYTAEYDGLCWVVALRDIKKTGKHAGEPCLKTLGYYTGPHEAAQAMIENGLAQSGAEGMEAIQRAIDSSTNRIAAALLEARG